MTEAPILSVAVPLYRERQTVAELHRRIAAALDPLGIAYEVVLVDDGSDDGQWDAIAPLAARDPRVRAIRLARNFGLQAAATAALAETRGRAVVLMDGDLQDPPELIPALLEKWREGFDIVATAKESRPEGLLKRLAFRAFYRVFALMSDVPLQAESGLFSLMDRRVVDTLVAMPERFRFLPGLRTWTGFRTATVGYPRGSRHAGTPTSTRKLVRMAVDALLSFSTLPLRLIIVLGSLLVLASLVGIGIIVWLRLAHGPEVIPGWASQMVAVIFMGAIQIVFLGVIAEYLGRIYHEVKGRPIYVVSERIAHDAARPAEAPAPGEGAVTSETRR